VDDFTIGEESLLRHLVRAADHELHDEDEQEDRSRLEEETQIHSPAEARPQPGDAGGADDASSRTERQVHGLAQLHQEQRRLEPLARDHQQREEEHAEERGGARTARRRFEPPFDVALHAPAAPPHVHGEPRHRCGGHHRQGPFEPFLVGDMEQRVATDGAHHERHGNPPVDSGHERKPARLAQERQTDGDDQKGFEPFTPRDDERLKHGNRRARK